jgi:L-cysteine/cystine lyase
VADHDRILDSGLAEGTARLDHGFPSALRSAWVLASLNVLEQAGWAWVHERAAVLAERLAAALTDRGVTVAARGRTTLVSWAVADAEAEVARLTARGFGVRSIPLGGLVRASVGAWSSEEELDRLVEIASRRA